LTGRSRASYGATSIRQRHLKQLVRTAASLPGPKLEIAPWSQLAAFGGDPSASEARAGRADPASRADAVEIGRLRALVADALGALARRIDEMLPAALAHARKAWEQVDDLVIVDPPLRAALGDARRWLSAAAADAPRRQSAVALEGLMTLDAAYGLACLAERRLSALIRLRVRGNAGERDDDLLPGGRPLLDLGAALAEAAAAWA
jgi:hypothetical protein